MFAALGRLTVRFRWPIIGMWLAGAFVLAATLPSLASVQKSNNAAFLPAGAPSVKAQDLAVPFQSKTNAVGIYVAATSNPSLSPADNAAVDRAERSIRSLPRVIGVLDQGVSANGRARKALVELNVPSFSNGGTAVSAVSDIRGTFTTAGSPPGLTMHLTGPVAQSVDQQKQNTRTQSLTEILSLVFILALLLLIFRALLAPFIALLPSAVALVAAGPIIATSTHLGVQVSDLTQILLTVILLGAGTDYGLFLIFRVREELRRGRSTKDAVSFALTKVGESITYSAMTVIAALASLVLATFGLYQGLGPGLAIGMVVALLANLTLLPALLAVLGPSIFWPRIPKVGQIKRGVWGHIAGRVVGRPVVTLVIGLVVFGGLALSMLAYSPAGFGDQPAPATSDSGRGLAVLVANYPAAESDPTNALFRLSVSAWDDPQVLVTAQRGLEQSGLFSGVTGALDPNGAVLSPTALADVHAQLQAYGPAGTLPPTPPPGVTVSTAVYDAYHASAQFISPDGRTIQFATTLKAGPSTGTSAARAIPTVRAAVADVGRQVHATATGVNGYAAVVADVSSISGTDLVRIIPLVLAVLALLLALVMRSLVAPVYLVLSVGLSYLASLGLAVLVFVVLGGQDGINFVLPFFMFIFIMALGEDYNILVMTRIREEAHHAPIRVAVRRAVEATGTTVTSAGLILAGTFGVLTVAGDTQVREIGLGLAAGVLLDTFLVRTLLVPSAVVLLGRWNWWPSQLSHEDHSHDRPAPTEEELAEVAETGKPIPGVDV